ncbi:hypothetical protein ACIRPH_00260 [Nocardiopsis sp. NPDC101807]|uniref:hypothetical protein n=1 Tax=Nocardiopsis sp. NPDC101807 TaxID=3364339 RepID=UPI0037F31412
MGEQTPEGGTDGPAGTEPDGGINDPMSDPEGGVGDPLGSGPETEGGVGDPV